MQIYFLLTEECNLNCAMCIRGKQHGANLDMDRLKIILEKNSLKNHDIVVTGGEPAIHERYVDIVRLLCGNARTVTITSNGTLDLKLDELSELNNLFFQISLDGDRLSHNKIRGEGSFELTWDTLKKMDSIGVKYSVASVIGKKNKDEIFKLIPKLESLKNIQHWKLSYEMPFGNAKKFRNFMRAEEWNNFVDKMIMKANLRLKIKKIFPFDLYDKRKADLIDGLSRRITNCGSGANKLYVYPNFDVYPCTCLTDFCVGNLKVQALDEILTSDLIKVFSEYNLDPESDCQDCEYKLFCNGGCIGMSYHYFGKIGMGDLRCPKFEGK